MYPARGVRRVLGCAAAAVAALLLGSFAQAETQTTGSLSVSTSVVSVCSAPSPSGNLTLPFNEMRTLTGQLISSSVTIRASCQGGGAITSLSFGDGLYATGSGNAMVRRMLDANADNKYLAYRLYKSDQSTQIYPSGFTGTDANANKTTYDNVSSIVQNIFGRIYDTVDGYASASDVPAGIFNDSVLLTLTYH